MKYVIIATQNQRKKWWESDCLPKALKTKSFDSFEEAKKCFRETIASEMAKSKNVKIKDGWYTELKKFVKDSDITPDENEDDVYITWRDVVTMNDILTKVVTDPNYFYPKKRLSVKSVMNDEFCGLSWRTRIFLPFRSINPKLLSELTRTLWMTKTKNTFSSMKSITTTGICWKRKPGVL